MQFAKLQWPTNLSLSTAYCDQFSTVKKLFDYDFQTEASWTEALESLDHSKAPRANRRELTAALTSFNKKLDNHAAAFANIARMEDESSVVIVGGQQAGLFTGPLLVIYKAITIIQAAKAAEERLQRPVIPIFWIAGEDHDYDEVNHIYSLSREMELERLRIESESQVRTSISRLTITPEQWEEALRQLDQSLQDTEYKPDLLQKLRGISAVSRTLTDSFGRIMAWLFGSHGLVMLDSDDPEIRHLEGPMFREIIENNQLLNEALLYGKYQVEQHGFVPQTEVSSGQANLFIFEQDERLLLLRTSDGYTDKKMEHHYSKAEMLGIADRQPELLSNNVMTRPLMQQYLLPVLGTVLGPGEIAYWALTRTAFHLFDMKMPILIPRSGYTLVEGTLQKNMDKFGMDMDDIVQRFDEKRNEWLREQDHLQLEQRFAAVKEEMKQIYTPVLELVANLNPGMQKLGETNLQKVLDQVNFMEKRAVDAFQSQHAASLRQMERIRLSMIPQNKPQERVYNIFAYLNKYGEHWLQELITEPLELTGEHRICYL